MRFKVSGYSTWYQVREVDMVEAVDTGNPDATHCLRGRHGYIYATMTETGRPKGGVVRVPDTSSGTYGKHVTFQPVNLTGHLIEED